MLGGEQLVRLALVARAATGHDPGLAYAGGGEQKKGMLNLTALVLALIAGYADTATFVQVSGLFSSHVTGNFVLFAAALGRGLRGVDYLKLLSFPVFIAGVGLTTAAHDWLGVLGPRLRSRWFLWTEAALLVAVGLAGVWRPAPQAGGAAQAVLAMVLVLAMAVQNTAHRLDPALGAPTTVMTGNVTLLTVTLARRLLGRAEATPRPPGPSLGEQALLVIAFAAGCVAAVPATLALGFAAVLLPGLLLVARLAAESLMAVKPN